MTQIIDPKLFYLIGLIDRANQIISICAVLLSVVLVICGCLYFVSYDDDYYDADEGIKLRKRIPIRALVITLVVCVLLLLLLPAKKDMTAMLIAKYATAENINAVIDAIKNAAQEISSVS